MALPTPPAHIHLIGIGGTGMSAIARVLLGQGYHVSGSDRAAGPLVPGLIAAGTDVKVGHDAAHITGADAVIVTSAAADDHVEVSAARAAGIPVYKRSDILGDLTRGKVVIAIAGTAGKTTTTAMIAHILITLGHDPSYIIGGTLPISGVNGHAGAGELFVIEADEYDNMFLGLTPTIAVITNIVYDHPDFFPTPDDMIASFRAFADRLTDPGSLIVCGDDPGARRLAEEWAAARSPDTHQLLCSYGFGDDEAFRPINLTMHDGLPSFRIALTRADGEGPSVQLSVPGAHNILNATAAYIAVMLAFIQHLSRDPNFEGITDALATFTGADRRFQIMGERDGVVVVDDYAHHPLKIRAALEAARSRYPDRAIWAVWQPHTYSRTQALWDEIVTCFADADHLLVTPIYAARESAIDGVTGEAIAAAIAQDHPDARYVESFAAAVDALRAEVREPAAVMILSAGDAPQIGRAYLEGAL